ncbi:CPBP family intramembrane metalloprotease [Candidatus Saccharibacteria bacterium]|nr:CPBP family intramembrane metalloprotease [Candidatus Saccharibacteria bacterium]
MPVKTAGELLLFALSTIVLPAIVEETIFRKQMICLVNRTAIICTTLLSAMLFAAEHFVTPWGVLLGMVWALPFSLAYSMTRNVYVPMTAHAIASILINGSTVVMTLFVVL